MVKVKNLTKTRIFGLALLFGMLTFTLAALFPVEVSAHGRRTVGKYQFIVGFLAEPAIEGQQNGIDLTVCNGECKTKVDGTLENPIEGLEKDNLLTAEVIFGSNTTPVKLAARFRAAGKYNGVFFPTQVGEYTFRFTGTINGDKIDERFTSGKDGFNSIEAIAPLQFPAVSGNTNNTSSLQQQVKEAKDSAGVATTFGIIGLVVGALGLIAGVAGFFMAQSARRAKALATSSANDDRLLTSKRGG